MTAQTAKMDFDESSRSWDDLPRGIYYLEDVAKYVRASDRALWANDVWLSPEVISDWAGRGFFEVSENEYRGGRRYINFAHLVTMRLIALLLSAEIAEEAIIEAHDYANLTSGSRYPMATRIFWTDGADGLSGIRRRFCEVLAASRGDGEIPFASMLNGDGANGFGMEFDSGGRAISWEPWEGIEIHPGYLSGAPRLKGRRIHADQIPGMLVAGDSRERVMWWLAVSEAELANAVRWDEELNKADLVSTA